MSKKYKKVTKIVDIKKEVGGEGNYLLSLEKGPDVKVVIRYIERFNPRPGGYLLELENGNKSYSATHPDQKPVVKKEEEEQAGDGVELDEDGDPIDGDLGVPDGVE